MKSKDVNCRSFSLLFDTHFSKFRFFKNNKTNKVCMDLFVRLSASLRYLRLDSVCLDTEFDWKKLKNLTEPYWKNVDGINVENFIEFFRGSTKSRNFSL